MKKLLLLIAFFGFGGIAHSQVRIGVISSYGISKGKPITEVFGNEQKRKSLEIGFLESKNFVSLGISLSSDFGPLFVNAEIHHRKNSYTLTVQNFLQIDEPMKYIEEQSSVIHVPIIGGFKIGNLRVGVGPTFNFQTNQSRGQLEIYDIEERKRNLQTGFLGSVGIDIGNYLRFGLKYEHSFTKVGDNYKYRGTKLPLVSTINYLTFNIGVYF